MPNLASAIKSEVSRLARREIRAQTAVMRKAVAQYRRDIAQLKRDIQKQARTLAFLEARERRRLAEQPPAAKAQKARFSAAGMRTHRRQLGISAADYGKLVGVSALTIYSWEQGKSRPRAKQMPGLVDVRGIGKREALKRLEILGKRRA